MVYGLWCIWYIQAILVRARGGTLMTAAVSCLPTDLQTVALWVVAVLALIRLEHLWKRFDRIPMRQPIGTLCEFLISTVSSPTHLVNGTAFGRDDPFLFVTVLGLHLLFVHLTYIEVSERSLQQRPLSAMQIGQLAYALFVLDMCDPDLSPVDGRVIESVASSPTAQWMNAARLTWYWVLVVLWFGRPLADPLLRWKSFVVFWTVGILCNALVTGEYPILVWTVACLAWRQYVSSNAPMTHHGQ
jgi:hypothetical protein